MTDGFLDAMIEHCPGWAYVLLLLTALGLSVVIAGMGMRMCVALLSRVRR